MNENTKKGLFIGIAVAAVALAVFMGMRSMGDPPLEKGQTNLNTGPRMSDLEKRGMPQFENKGGAPAPGGEPDMGGAIGNRGG